MSDPFAKKRLSEINRADVLDLRSRLLAKCPPATVNKALGIVKVIFREALYLDGINRDPTAGAGKIKEWKKSAVFSRGRSFERFFLIIVTARGVTYSAQQN